MTQPDPRKVMHYKGNRVLLDMNKIVGPDMDGGFWKPVAATYDHETDCTTVEFLPVPPDQWSREMVLVRTKQMSNRERTNYLAGLLNPNRRQYTQ